MGDVIPLGRRTISASAECAEAITLALHKAAHEVGRALVPGDPACSILLEAIVDHLGRGTRDVSQLCDAALAKLREVQACRIGREKPSRST
jgi:hypothetical protein